MAGEAPQNSHLVSEVREPCADAALPKRCRWLKLHSEPPLESHRVPCARQSRPRTGSPEPRPVRAGAQEAPHVLTHNWLRQGLNGPSHEAGPRAHVHKLMGEPVATSYSCRLE